MRHLDGVTLVAVDTRPSKSEVLRALRICQRNFSFDDVLLVVDPLYTDIPYGVKRIVKEGGINNHFLYSKYVITDLYKHINTPKLLICQYDGFIVNPGAWDDDFLNYDYIGAPWGYLDNNVGNGGFSLRSRNIMEMAAKVLPRTNATYSYEDDSICRRNRHLFSGFNFAPESIASKFSFEMNARHQCYNGAFGIHGAHATQPISAFMQYADKYMPSHIWSDRRHAMNVWTELQTQESIAGPVAIKATIKTERYNIRLLGCHGASVIFNWEGNPRELRVTRPDGDKPCSGTLVTATVEPLHSDMWHDIEWRICEGGMSICVNGEMIYDEDASYVLAMPSPAIIRSNESILHVDNLSVNSL